jgi:pyruvate dehydrogenase E2 component (dihydrolipoamide acetyltransferase)
VAGTVLKLLYASGEDVPVLKPIAVIGAVGENWQAAMGTISQEASHAESLVRGTETQKEEEGKSAPSSNVSAPLREPSSGKIFASPRARNLAEKEALPLETVPGTGPGGRIIEKDVAATLQTRPPLSAAAKAAGPEAVPAAGSGIGGRVTSADLAPSPEHPSPLPNEGAITETPVKGIRKIIADRMYKSLAETAQLTLNSSAPVSKLQEIRFRIKAQEEIEAIFIKELKSSKITVTDLILFAVSRTLPRFPFMNAHKINDTVRTFERVHLGLAVDTPRGLMVPVIRNANLLSLREISREAKRLAETCQGGSVSPDELSGSTFTVTNLGSLGVTSFTPVLNAPEVAILGVCGIEMKPIALPAEKANECNCGVRFEPHIGFSLTINHQVVDGAPAARFLRELGEAVAQIDLLFVAG